MKITYNKIEPLITLSEALTYTRKQHIKQAVKLSGNNIALAARLLGLKSRSPIYRILYPDRYSKSVSD